MKEYLHRIFHKIFKKLHFKSLRSYIIFVTTGMIALALTISTVFFYCRTSSTLKASFQDQMMQQLNTSLQQVSDQIHQIDSLNILLTSNNLIYDALDSTASETASISTIERQMTYLLITNFVWEENFINSVSIYAKNGVIYQVSTGESPHKDLSSLDIYNHLDTNAPSLKIFSSDASLDGDLYFVRNIFSSNTGQSTATIVTAINRTAWMNHLTQSFESGWSLYLYSNDLQLSNESDLITIAKKEDYYYVSENLDSLDITAVIGSPKSAIQTKLNSTLQIYLLIMLIIILIVLIVAYALSNAAVYPISHMINHVNRIADGHYEETIPENETYEEFQSLTRAFNNMLAQLNAYHADNLENQLLLKNAEIKELQSQIDPHFLFNTLNTLAWKAQMSGDTEVYQMSIALGELLKTNTLSKGDDFLLPLKDELNYVRMYIYLQKMRFEDKITILFDIDPDLDEYLVPYFCIQTLVENAFVHGLEPQKETGRLAVSVKQRSDSLCVSVSDNGIGFPNIPDLHQKTAPDSNGTHIGLWNLNRRLYLLYGKSAELSIQSVPKQQTTISFQIPYERRITHEIPSDDR